MKTNVFILMVLILVSGSTLFSSCTWDVKPDEDQLGASRPNTGIHGDVFLHGLNGTKWRWHDSNINVYVTFTATDCSFDYSYLNSTNKTTTKYKYSLRYPIVTLTPENNNDRALIGTVKPEGFKEDHLITFVYANDSKELFTVDIY